MDGLAFLFGQRQGPREKLLFVHTEQFLGAQLVLAGTGAAENAQVQDDDILVARVHAVQDGGQVVERVVVADHHQHVAGTHAKRFGRKFVARLEVELIEFGVGRTVLFGDVSRRFRRRRKRRW